MLKKIYPCLLIFFGFLFLNKGFAQEKTEFDRLIEQANNEVSSKPQKASKTLEMAEKLIENEEQQLEFLLTQVQFYFVAGNRKKSAETCNEGLKLAQKNKNWTKAGSFIHRKSYVDNQPKQLLYKAFTYYKKSPKTESKQAKIWIDLIPIYANEGKTDSTRYAIQQVNTLLKTPSSEEQAHLYDRIGMAHNLWSNLDSAVFYMIQAVNWADKTDNINLQIMTNNNLALVYGGANNNDQALEAYAKSIRLMQENNIVNGILGVYVNRANTYKRMNKFELALKDFQKALKYAQSSNNMVSQARIGFNLGMLYNDTQQLDKAIDAFQNSNKICKKIGMDMGYMFNAYGLGEVFLKQKKYTEANINLKEAIQLAKKYKNQGVLKEAYKQIADINAKLNNFKLAYEYHKKYRAIQDSIYTTTKDKNITEMQTKYETEKKEQENKLLKAENAQVQSELDLQQTQLYGSIIGIILVLGIAVVLQRSRQIQRKTNQKLATANQKLKELDEFKQTATAMIVHDLKNPLNTVIGNSEKIDLPISQEECFENIQQSGKKMLNLVQNILDVQKFEDAQIKPNPENISLQKLVNQSIQQVGTFSKIKNLTLRNDVSANTFIAADSDLTGRILVNLLTNAIKYSAQNQIITITSKIQSEKVEIQVKDEGIGIPTDFLPKIFDKFSQTKAKKLGIARSTGLGLTFCQMATEIQGGKIWVESKIEEGSTFSFTLPKGKSEKYLVQNQAEKGSLFSTEIIEMMHPFTEQLRQIPIYQMSSLTRIIRQIPEPNEQMKTFKNELKNSIYTANQERFNELIQEFS